MASDDSGSALARLGLRGLVEGMHEQLDELLVARDQMEQLLRLIVQIGSDLDLDATLQRLVTAAMGLTGARYGALGVRGADGGLVSFLHRGMDADTVRRLGQLPTGKGLLGWMLERTDAVRLDDLTQHPSAAGFPEHHPPMRAFLGMPITVRGTVFGSLYLADDRPDAHFTESDESAAQALASAAGVTIDNARLFDRVARSARWATASREIITALLSDARARPLQLIAKRAAELTEAEQGIVLVPVEPDVPTDDIDTLVVSTAVGVHADEVTGQQVPMSGSTAGDVFRSGAPMIVDAFRHAIPGFTDVGDRPAIVMPLRAGDTVLGVIAVARNPYQPQFDPSLLDLVSDFAGHAAMALTLATARARERELTVVADRERIARDLHDHVIQKLFAAGMDLQGTLARARSPEVRDRLTRTIDQLQSTIEDIRATIFGLHASGKQASDFRHRIQRAVSALTDDREIGTTLRISGAISIVGDELAEHAEAVLSEAVSNAVRHSGASHLTIEVAVADELTIDVIDDGRGIPDDIGRRSGLVNITQRAEQLGGTCEFGTSERGTHVHWTAPLRAF